MILLNRKKKHLCAVVLLPSIFSVILVYKNDTQHRQFTSVVCYCITNNMEKNNQEIHQLAEKMYALSENKGEIEYEKIWFCHNRMFFFSFSYPTLIFLLFCSPFSKYVLKYFCFGLLLLFYYPMLFHSCVSFLFFFSPPSQFQWQIGWQIHSATIWGAAKRTKYCLS